MPSSVCLIMGILVWEDLIRVMAAIFFLCQVNLLNLAVLWEDIFR